MQSYWVTCFFKQALWGRDQNIMYIFLLLFRWWVLYTCAWCRVTARHGSTKSSKPAAKRKTAAESSSTPETPSKRLVFKHRVLLMIMYCILLTCFVAAGCTAGCTLLLLLPLHYDCDLTTIWLWCIARACFQFDTSKKWTHQFFVIVVSQSNRTHIVISITSVDASTRGIVVS